MKGVGIQRGALKARVATLFVLRKQAAHAGDGRTDLQALLDFLQPGDVLIVTRIDRLARSLRDLQNIVHELKERRMRT
jgi:DNA invertase Pin-like site-specific DNA recombinase